MREIAGSLTARTNKMRSLRQDPTVPDVAQPLPRRPASQEDGAEQIEDTVIRSDNCDTRKVTA